MAKDNMGQEQIDALFHAIKTGGGEEVIDNILRSPKDTLKEYDFSRPDKFNPENIRSLNSIFRTFTKNVSQRFLTNQKPINFSLNPIIEQVPFGEEYVEKVPKGEFVFCVVELGNEDLGKIIIEIDAALIRPINQSFFGAGKDIKIEAAPKYLTDLDMAFLEDWVSENILPQLSSAFKNVIHMNLEIIETKTDISEATKITISNDMVAIVELDVEIYEKSKTIRLIFPYLSVEPVIEKLTSENVSEIEFKDYTQDREEILKTHLKTTQQIIEIELGKTQIPFKELKELRVGDLLVLDRKVDQTLIGYIGGIPKFSCLPGKQGKWLAVKVVEIAKEGVEEHGG